MDGVKERGILMSAPMVVATVRAVKPKTQTRRAVNWHGLEPGLNLKFSGLTVERSGSNWVLSSPTRTSHEYRSVPMPCPYGRPGDRLWVREAWRVDVGFNDVPPRDIDACATVFYEATDGPADGFKGRLRPGMFMPRWASRITLEITGVRVERLQDISEADAIAEGTELIDELRNPTERRWRAYGNESTESCTSAVASYRTLWESINGAGSWDANPWVWVVEFRRVRP
ncbi:hypothetical protein D9M73_68910 [compost metagenome]